MSNHSTASLSVGQFAEFSSAVLRQLPRALEGVDIDTVQRWIENGDALAQVLHDGFVPTDRLNNAALSNVYHITVNRNLGLKPLVVAGHYDYENSDITAEHFPIKGSGIIEEDAVLVHFNRSISTDAALAELDRMGLRAGDIAELLAFGEQHPEVQRKFPIVELASVWAHRVGDRCVAYLWSHAGERHLYLHVVAYDWHGHYRFLAFRKS